MKMLKEQKLKMHWLSERGKTQEVAYCMFVFITHSGKDKTIEITKKLVVFGDWEWEEVVTTT